MKTLLIGGGCLGKSLALHYRNQGSVDVITRSLFTKHFYESHRCRHFARDLSNPRFKMPSGIYDLVIFCAAVTVDARSQRAESRLFVNGMERLLRELYRLRFQGRLVVTGCASALEDIANPAASGKNTGSSVVEWNEETLLTSQATSANPFYSQFNIWQRQKDRCGFPFLFILPAILYGKGRVPFNKIARGLCVTSLNPRLEMNFIHALDAARAVIHLEKTRGNSDLFFVSDNNPLTFETYSKILCRELGLPPLDFTRAGRRASPAGFRMSNTKLLKTGFKLENPKFNPKLLVL